MSYTKDRYHGVARDLEAEADAMLGVSRSDDRQFVKSWDQIMQAWQIQAGLAHESVDRAHEWDSWSDPEEDLRESAMPKVAGRDSTATRALFAVDPTPWQRRMVVVENAHAMAESTLTKLKALTHHTDPLTYALTWCHTHDRQLLDDYVGLADDPYEGLPLGTCETHDDCEAQRGRALFLATWVDATWVDDTLTWVDDTLTDESDER